MDIGGILNLDEETLKKATAVSEQLLDDSFIMLHVTDEEKTQSILSNGLRHSNPHISLTLATPENAEDIALYTYQQGWDREAKFVIGIPHAMFDKKNGDELAVADKEYLSCVFEKNADYGYALPPLFIKGHFDNEMNFVKNPNYILEQPNANELMQIHSDKMRKEFFEWAGRREESLVKDKIKKSVEGDLKKQGYDNKEIFKAIRFDAEKPDNADAAIRIKNIRIKKQYSELNNKYSEQIKGLKDLLPKTSFALTNKSRNSTLDKSELSL